MNMTRHDDVTQLLDQWVGCGWLRELDRALVRFLHQECPDAPPLLLLGAALVSYQLGRGHVCLDLAATLADSGFSLALPPEGDRSENRKIARPAAVLAGVTLSAWQAALQQPQLVSSGEGSTPLVLVGARLYLRRYWRYEQDVRHAITQQLTQNHALRAAIAPAVLRQRLDALFPTAAAGPANWQKLACALAAGSAFSIITGGPGTGKTTTVVKLLALLQSLALEQHGKPLRIRLAAPTGKAAARLNESIAGAIAGLMLDGLAQGEAIREHINSEVVTLHRLLGSRPDTRHFRHHADNPLMLDVLVVDEASMVDLEMMAALLAAMPARSRLILLGDKDQLASVEAGALMGELCQRAAQGHYLPQTRDWLREVAGDAPDDALLDPHGSALDQSIAMLRHSYRFGADSGIGQLAEAVNAGDAAALAAVWQHGYADLARLTLTANDNRALREWVIDGAVDRFACQPHAAPPVGYGDYLRRMASTRPALTAAQSEFDVWAAQILDAFGQFQLLCALRNGPWGVDSMNERIAHLLYRDGLLAAWQGWYPGRPVMVTRNDYSQRLMNGDIGITLPVPLLQPDGSRAWVTRVAFPAGDGSSGIRWVLPGRLSAVETVFAMTVHKSQGSEFAHTALLLPDCLSPILTRELVYTGITRAKHAFSLGCVGEHSTVLAEAVGRRVLRVSGRFP
ncbi:exodeoxyribonuclease V subunit alpha [Dickeya dianthicola]|uniref:exodeoxyribonuclease V subunit alpha n=1 Tax=Dickeya dianthicola TaxID=204039 RepID=UPI001868ED80|nr:exodeoxyribonuclease V subunit alpha [Dickeya dianthicola]QOL14711.1 exodeoxyribonuclease V subunit alpha [Dickeya dianthicola]